MDFEDMANEPIFAFDEPALLRALDTWKAKQLAAYPHQKDRIEVTVLAMRDFFGDEEVLRHHKLVIGSSPTVASTVDPSWDDPLGSWK